LLAALLVALKAGKSVVLMVFEKAETLVVLTVEWLVD
jgi:hypothetical protein